MLSCRTKRSTGIVGIIPRRNQMNVRLKNRFRKGNLRNYKERAGRAAKNIASRRQVTTAKRIFFRLEEIYR